MKSIMLKENELSGLLEKKSHHVYFPSQLGLSRDWFLDREPDLLISCITIKINQPFKLNLSLDSYS